MISFKTAIAQQSPLLNPPIFTAYGNETTAHTIFSDSTWFHKLEQVIGATGLRADA